MRVLFLIEIEDQLVSVDHGGSAFTKGETHAHRIEIFLPKRLAVHIENEHAARAKEGVDALAVGHRIVRGEASVAKMIALMRSRGAGRAFPNDVAVFAAETDDDELVFNAGATSAAGSTTTSAFLRLGWPLG